MLTKNVNIFPVFSSCFILEVSALCREVTWNFSATVNLTVGQNLLKSTNVEMRNSSCLYKGKTFNGATAALAIPSVV
jgi:hypothetical protein